MFKNHELRYIFGREAGICVKRPYDSRMKEVSVASPERYAPVSWYFIVSPNCFALTERHTYVSVVKKTKFL